MTKRVLVTLLVLAGVLCGHAAIAGDYRIDEEQSSIRFTVPYHFMIVGAVEGSFGSFSGDADVDLEDLARSRIHVVIEAASLDTQFDPRDLSLRDEHFFAVERYPTIVFDGQGVDESGDETALVGKLTLHGEQREVSVPFELLEFGESLVVMGRARINRLEFGIEGPMPSPEFRIGEEVMIRITLVLRKAP